MNEKNHIIKTSQPMKHTPQWLIFPDIIINTAHIINMYPCYKEKAIYFCDKTGTIKAISAPNTETTWAALQHAFTEGV